jgi:hypothetical protein
MQGRLHSTQGFASHLNKTCTTIASASSSLTEERSKSPLIRITAMVEIHVQCHANAGSWRRRRDQLLEYEWLRR